MTHFAYSTVNFHIFPWKRQHSLPRLPFVGCWFPAGVWGSVIGPLLKTGFLTGWGWRGTLKCQLTLNTRLLTTLLPCPETKTVVCCLQDVYNWYVPSSRHPAVSVSVRKDAGGIRRQNCIQRGTQTSSVRTVWLKSLYNLRQGCVCVLWQGTSASAKLQPGNFCK